MYVFSHPCILRKKALDRSLVSFLLGWENEKRSIDKIKISGVRSIFIRKQRKFYLERFLMKIAVAILLKK